VLTGEPEALIARALAADPKNLKALALAGTIAFERGNYALAVKHWEGAIASAGGEGELAANLRSGIAEARQRGGLAEPAAAAAPAAAASVSVSGRVTIAKALAAQAAPGDTLFVFARPAEGSRMPLALLRAQVKDLPLDFSLDDRLAMNPAARLSSAKQVVIGARISKSGQAMPQPGDLQGFSAPVAVGSKGVAVQISETVAKP
jgi:cytochrome c-type biogenesis protein CcmH